MVNNFQQIKKLLQFPSKDNFYFLQILQRKKDFPGVRLGGSNNNSRLIKAYYITSVEKLEIHEEEIIKLCNLFGARAGINLNPRSFEKAYFALMVKLANQGGNRNYFDASKAYDSVCGDYHSEMDKRWLIDIDTQDAKVVSNIQEYIEDLQAEIHNRQYGVLAIIPSKSGVHLVTNPFNLAKFTEKFPEIEVHKNNPTNLYIP